MHRLSKLMWSTASLSLLAFSHILCATEDAQVRNLENRVAALEQRKSASGMINPNGRPQANSGADLFFTADFLWWVANENGLGFVVRNSSNADYVNAGKLKNPDFDYDPGLRLGIGYSLPHDGWDVCTNWTWMRSKSDRHVSRPSGGHLFPTFLNINKIDVRRSEGGDQDLSSADARWRVNLNVIDLELGRQFFVSKWLTLRPHFGLRNAWIYQSFRLNYDGIFNTYFPSEEAVSGGLLETNKCNFWGLGLRGGLNTQWGLGCGFSVYGDMAISLLFGRFHIDEQQWFETCNRISSNGSCSCKQCCPDEDIFDWKNKFTACRAVTDLGAGLRWGKYMQNESYHLCVQLGWEQHLFFGQNMYDRVVDDYNSGITVSNQGDLSYNGLTFSVRVDL